MEAWASLSRFYESLTLGGEPLTWGKGPPNLVGPTEMIMMKSGTLKIAKGESVFSYPKLKARIAAKFPGATGTSVTGFPLHDVTFNEEVINNNASH